MTNDAEKAFRAAAENLIASMDLLAKELDATRRKLAQALDVVANCEHCRAVMNAALEQP